MVEQGAPVVWDILDEVIREAPGSAEPRSYTPPFGYPSIPAQADRRQGYPASPAGMYGVQRRLRR